MANRVSKIGVRQGIGDMLERLEQMRRFARRHALDVMEQQKGGTLSDVQAMALGLKAQRWARRQKPKRGVKRTKSV